MSVEKENLWCVIPASGVGVRMGSGRPKQYMELGGKKILEWTLQVFVGLPEVRSIIVGIADSDTWWPTIPFSTHKNIHTSVGGAERIQTVINGLKQLRQLCRAQDYDWVLVHDAVRPCVLREDVIKLVQTCRQTDHGGLLGCEIVDTVKRADEQGKVVKTESRKGLWRAMTPQMFRLRDLESALLSAMNSGHYSTDESAAMELAGYQPQIVSGDPSNIKITRLSDIKLAETILGQQQCA